MTTSRLFYLFMLAGLMLGCTATRPPVPGTPGVRSDVPVGYPHVSNTNEEQLAALWAARYGKPPDFPIGAGDVLQISVPGLGEFKERTVRVDEDGNISMPLLGTIHAAGLTEDGVRKELVQRLNEYMYHPQVDLFVKTFSSRQTAVLGEVRNPGMYTLNGPGDTVREMIQRAGGMTDNAAQEILLTPSGPGMVRTATVSNGVREVALVTGGKGPAAGNSIVSDQGGLPATGAMDGYSAGGGTITPLVMGLGADGRDDQYLGTPVTPGDTIYVPRAGMVTVTGWVYSPKVIPITPGLTVLGAVSAAGGPLFAADMAAVKVVRQGGNGQLMVLKTDLEKVKKLQAPDVRVQANDVIEVPYSALRIPGYAVYYAVQGLFMWAPATMVTSGVP
jgi:polysaccharide biosynthesis/export protein